jgi:hypothetical protein
MKWIWEEVVENAVDLGSRNTGNEKWKTETKSVRKTG